MSWFKKLFPSKIRTKSDTRRGSVPEGVWIKCDNCLAALYGQELESNLQVCSKCSHHLRLSGRKRLDVFLDAEGREEIAANIQPIDILKFKDSKKYRDRIHQAQKNTGEKDALVVMAGLVKNSPVVAAAFDFDFIGGSMGAVVGEKFVQGVEYAIKHNLPFICFSTSGGARMQEGLFSLFQMAKTSAALKKLANKKLPYISVLVNPTFGGVSASLAMLGDINIAEPKALIGFAGPRVIEQTVREILPEGFQKSEFLLEHGFVDRIIDRRDLRDEIKNIVSFLAHG